MKIVQISNNKLTVPPRAYGGTQRDIYYLTEELIRRGHEVVLFAKKGSNAHATQTFEYPFDDNNSDKIYRFIMQHLPQDVDIIHDHTGIVSRTDPPIPTIRNSHLRKKTIGSRYPVYVSKTILEKYGENIGYYVHNGIRLADYKFREKKGDYLLFLGRLTPEKGVHLAIEVARKTGLDLIIAGPYEHNKKQMKYYKEVIRPQLDKQIRYVGNVGGKKKQDLLSKARCVLFPSIWDEPFGLVLIESLACGTPVLGFKYGGAVREVLHGLPQLLCNNVLDMAIKVLTRKDFPAPQVCRNYVEQHFTDRVMTDNFLKLYKKIIEIHKGEES
ncbi:glycosyltransferase family 4 protein [Paenibacillus sp. GD4]|uniref:glycosyltransferase family 4 protein n=1 Tax=Paenibacillus sp. GD4 TaxID=3068890 RepID=UPI0027969E00|nr:glycosyltransferase family 4 protein [Paenibacillus sp. GD4]MDQ1912294.1 glycosyltransferase family 4 protein [Paenibacillus sp. GD4]